MKNARRQLPDRSDIVLTPTTPVAPVAPVDHKVEWIDITQIKADGGTQMRAGLNWDRVNEYAEEMAEARSWGKFPHVVVFYDGTNYWLADGFHRVTAAETLPLMISTVPAEVNSGDRRDAVLYAAGANAAHGLPRTAADKRRAIETLLRDEEWAKWSDREIGRRCAVSRTTVGIVRAELSLSKLDSENAGERTYITRHGTEAVMKVGNIGAAQYAAVWELEGHVRGYLNSRGVHDLVMILEILDNKKASYHSEKLAEFLVGKEVSYRKSDLTQAIKNVLEQERVKEKQAQARTVYMEPKPKVDQTASEIVSIPLTDYGDEYGPLAEFGYGLQRTLSGSHYRWVLWADAHQDHASVMGEWLDYPQAACEAAVEFNSRGETLSPDMASVETLREALQAWVASVSKDVDTQTYYLKNIQEGRNETSLYQLIGHMKRVSQIHAYRDEDLTEAIKSEFEERTRRRAEKDAKRGPKPPDEWDLRKVIETWLKGKDLAADPRHQLLTELREKEDKHPEYAEMTAALPEHWRKRELNRALSNLIDSLSWEVGVNDWVTVQLPSGRWYAHNKMRHPKATAIFETEGEALGAVERANIDHMRLYGNLKDTIGNPIDVWHLRDFFRDAPVDVVAEAKIGLEKLAAQADAPPYVAERLKRVEKRMEDAQRLLQMTATQHPSDQPEFDEWAGGAVSLDRDWSAEELSAYVAANQVVVTNPSTVTITLDRAIAEKLHAAALVFALKQHMTMVETTELEGVLKGALYGGGK